VCVLIPRIEEPQIFLLLLSYNSPATKLSGKKKVVDQLCTHTHKTYKDSLNKENQREREKRDDSI
jgi:hypothetical protein